MQLLLGGFDGQSQVQRPAALIRWPCHRLSFTDEYI
jgi:hypothetical protein